MVSFPQLPAETSAAIEAYINQKIQESTTRMEEEIQKRDTVGMRMADYISEMKTREDAMAIAIEGEAGRMNDNVARLNLVITEFQTSYQTIVDGAQGKFVEIQDVVTAVNANSDKALNEVKALYEATSLFASQAVEGVTNAKAEALTSVASLRAEIVSWSADFQSNMQKGLETGKFDFGAAKKPYGPKMDKKIYIQKFRRRKNSRRRTGHRQIHTRVRIENIAGV